VLAPIRPDPKAHTAAKPPTQAIAPVPQLRDERRVLQIGLAFALFYIVFLAFWFWGTREGRHRFEGATRF
jgi:hypothetical protein